MNLLILLILLTLPGFAAPAQEPHLLVPAQTTAWTNPVISPDGLKIAFADASYKQIRLFELGTDSSRLIASNPGVGRRFVFEPGSQERIVYRRMIEALPDKPERLLSVSIYLHDPISRTANTTGKMFGPYLLQNSVWYRDSLTGPFKDYKGHIRKAGPYLDLTNGQLNVLNPSGKTVFTSTPSQRFAAMEISPDGKQVAAVQTDPDRGLLIISVANGAVTRVDNAADPGWAGNSMTAICVRHVPEQPPELYRIHLPQGSGETVLSSPDFDPETPVLNADGSKVVFVSRGAIYDLEIAP